MSAARNPRPAPMARGERITRPPRLGRPRDARRHTVGVGLSVLGLLLASNASAVEGRLQWHDDGADVHPQQTPVAVERVRPDSPVSAQDGNGPRRSLGLALSLGLVGAALWRRED